VTGCRPRGRRSARAARCCCSVWFVWPPSRRVLLQRVAGWPLLPYRGAKCLPARATLPLSYSILPPVWRSLLWCREEWPQGLTDPHWRHHPLRVCGRFCSNPHPCYAIRVARAKSEQVSRYWAICRRLETLDFEHLSTWRDAVLYVPGVASTPSSATSLIGRSFSAGLIGGLFCLACGVPDSLPARPVYFSRWTSVANPIAQEIIE
jgi:hypothetical protein